jgi:hypothetical protein
MTVAASKMFCIGINRYNLFEILGEKRQYAPVQNLVDDDEHEGIDDDGDDVIRFLAPRGFGAFLGNVSSFQGTLLLNNST